MGGVPRRAADAQGFASACSLSPAQEASARDAAIALLIEQYWARQEQRAGRTVLVLNPALPWEE